MGATVALRGASVVLDDRAVLRDVDLELREGLTVVRGPNGSGKTTLLRALCGLVPLARGRREAASAPLYVAHRPQLLRGLTARENLRFFLGMRLLDPSLSVAFDAGGGPEASIGSALEAWGLAAEADRPVERLSAGQRRRAALARLELEGWPVALLDEPFGELDEEAAALLHRRIAWQVERRGIVVVATHGRDELDERADRVVRLRDGALVA